MSFKIAPSLKRPEIFFLSLGGIGLLPKAPGTWGSLAVVPLLYVLNIFEAPAFLVAIPLFVLTVLSIYITEYAQRVTETHDPSWVVMDEAIGMVVTWCLVPSHNLRGLILIFIFFRAFDIFKVYPASWLDKRVKHGAGTILDDVISGVYAGGLVALLESVVF